LLQDERPISHISQGSNPTADFFKFVSASNALSSIGELSRFDDPIVVSFVGFVLRELCHKLLELIIEKPLLDVEGQRDCLEHTPTYQLIVLSQHVEHSFFVAQQTIQNDMVVDYL